MHNKNSITNYNSILQGNYRVETVFTIAGTDYTKANLVSASINGSLYDELSIGKVFVRALEISLRNIDVDDIPAGATVPVKQRIYNSMQTSGWVKRGTFYVARRVIEGIKLKLTCYDKLYSADIPFMKSGTWVSTTALDVVQSICTILGISLNADTQSLLTSDSVAIDYIPVIGENGTTLREMLQYIGTMYAGNWTIDDENTLKLIPLNTLNTTTYVEAGLNCKSLSVAPALPAVDRVELINDSTVYYSPEVDDATWDAMTGSILIARCPYASQSLANRIRTKVLDFVYQGYNAKTTFIDPSVELGDTVHIDGIYSIIAKQEITISAKSPQTISTEPIKSEEKDEYPYVSPIERQVSREEAERKASVTVLEDSITLEASQRQLADQEEAEAREQSNAEFSQTISQIQVQTDNISSTVQEIQANNTQMQTSISQTANGLEVLSSQMETVSGYVNGQSAYLRWDGGSAILSIGSSSYAMHTEIRPTGFAVVNGGVDIFLATGDKISLPRGVLEIGTGQGAYAKVGRYKWIDEGSSGFSLMYVG